MIYQVKGVYENYPFYLGEKKQCEKWIEFRGKHGTPSSIRALLKDADDIEEMLKKLVGKLED